MNYKYGDIKSGTIRHPKSFWQFLDMMAEDSFASNKSHYVRDASDNNSYADGYGIPYWPQNLQPGSSEWYYVGSQFSRHLGQYRFDGDEFQYARPGWYRLIGTEGSWFGAICTKGLPDMHDFLLFEDDAGNRIRVRPGTLVLSERIVMGASLREGFAIPRMAKTFWPTAATKCKLEDGPSTRQSEPFSLKREIADLVIATVLWFVLCSISKWNVLFFIPFTVFYIGFAWLVIARISNFTGLQIGKMDFPKDVKK